MVLMFYATEPNCFKTIRQRVPVVPGQHRLPPPVSLSERLLGSTEAGQQDIASARAAGANYYVVKPLKRELLTELVGMLCGVTA